MRPQAQLSYTALINWHLV